MLIMSSISRGFKKLGMGLRDQVPRSSLSISSHKASYRRSNRMAAATGMSKYVQNKHLSRHQNVYTSNSCSSFLNSVCQFCLSQTDHIPNLHTLSGSVQSSIFSKYLSQFPRHKRMSSTETSADRQSLTIDITALLARQKQNTPSDLIRHTTSP